MYIFTSEIFNFCYNYWITHFVVQEITLSSECFENFLCCWVISGVESSHEHSDSEYSICNYLCFIAISFRVLSSNTGFVCIQAMHFPKISSLFNEIREVLSTGSAKRKFHSMSNGYYAYPYFPFLDSCISNQYCSEFYLCWLTLH